MDRIIYGILLIWFAAIFTITLFFLSGCALDCRVEYAMENGIHCEHVKDNWSYFYDCNDGKRYINPWNVTTVKVCR